MPNPAAPRPALQSDPNFRWLMSGGVISGIGDQLTIVALPWLVLKLTGSALALGLVIALMGIPRAAFILLGGALVDRYSPKRVLMLSKMVNAVLLALVAVFVMTVEPGATWQIGSTISIVLGPRVILAIICVLAFCLGLAQAFAIPSGTSIMPQVLASHHLEAANGMLMGVRQMSMLVGPLLAALLIAFAGDGAGGISDAPGLAWAFAFDSLSFLLSAWTLSQVRLHVRADTKAPEQSVLGSIGAGMRMVWNDEALRLCFMYWGVVVVFIGGLMQVAIPVLASQYLQGASSLGLLMGASGAGSLLGMLAAAAIGKRLVLVSFGTTILLVDAISGVLVAPVGSLHATWLVSTLLLLIGVLSGFMQITVYTWIQRRVPVHMMGRAMSIFMFIFMGMAPLSAAGTGWLLTVVALPQLFLGGGAVLVALSASAWLFTPMRHIGRKAPTAP
jgi:MFS family permease